MIFSRNQQPLFPIPEEGDYNAEVVNWKKGKQANTSMGPTDTVLVTFKLETNATVVQSILVIPGPNSLVEKLINSTIGEDEVSVHFDSLIGQECGVEIAHNRVGDKTYANVVDIFVAFDDEIEEGFAEDEDFYE